MAEKTQFKLICRNNKTQEIVYIRPLNEKPGSFETTYGTEVHMSDLASFLKLASYSVIALLAHDDDIESGTVLYDRTNMQFISTNMSQINFYRIDIGLAAYCPSELSQLEYNSLLNSVSSGVLGIENLVIVREN